MLYACIKHSMWRGFLNFFFLKLNMAMYLQGRIVCFVKFKSNCGHLPTTVHFERHCMCSARQTHIWPVCICSLPKKETRVSVNGRGVVVEQYEQSSEELVHQPACRPGGRADPINHARRRPGRAVSICSCPQGAGRGGHATGERRRFHKFFAKEQ
jgi:hypothetical protein